MTQEGMKDQTQIAVEITMQEDYGDLIPDFAIQQMARFFFDLMSAEENIE